MVRKTAVVAPELPADFWSAVADIENAARQNGVSLRLDQSQTEVEAMELWVETDPASRGNGYASAAVKQLCELADGCGIPITLIAEAKDPAGGLTQADLTAWYERLGFRAVGRAPSAGGAPMRREPTTPRST